MTTITEYAHLYLQGYSTIPIGVLDSTEFKSEVRVLSGWTPEREAEQRQYEIKTLKRLEKVLTKVQGPRGGIPKEYRYIARAVEQLKRELA